MVTIKEIAEKAGVTTTTVSNVIHGKVNRVSPEMVEKIQNILKETNYIPRFGLNALTNKSSKIICVLVNTPDFVEYSPYERPFYSTVIGTLENELRKLGYYIMLYSSKNMQEIMRTVLGWNVDGIITISLPKKYHEQIERSTAKPTVAIDMVLDENDTVGGLYNVTLKDYYAGRMMMRYLVERGIKEIMYAVNIKEGSDYNRYRGAGDVYKETFGQELALVILDKKLENRYAQYEAMTDLAGKMGCVQFSTDLSALEAVGFFVKHKIRVPEDISVTGFDDDIYARLSVPGITTMKNDCIKKAQYAAQMLMARIGGKVVDQNNLALDAHLVERQSVIAHSYKGAN